MCQKNQFLSPKILPQEILDECVETKPVGKPTLKQEAISPLSEQVLLQNKSANHGKGKKMRILQAQQALKKNISRRKQQQRARNTNKASLPDEQ